MSIEAMDIIVGRGSSKDGSTKKGCGPAILKAMKRVLCCTDQGLP
jgi:adenylosuccinate synthase